MKLIIENKDITHSLKKGRFAIYINFMSYIILSSCLLRDFLSSESLYRQHLMISILIIYKVFIQFSEKLRVLLGPSMRTKFIMEYGVTNHHLIKIANECSTSTLFALTVITLRKLNYIINKIL